MNLFKEKYKKWNMFYYNDKFNSIGKNIIDNNFEIVKILKDTKRNYVGIIKIDNTMYILKEIRSEVIIPQRNFLTLFKKGEALTTLINCNKGIEEGLTEIVTPYIALVKRNFFIKKSFLLMEFIDGVELKTKEDVIEVIRLAKKIHSHNRVHSDLNTSNFIKIGNQIKILDTQLKKEKYWFYRRNYDIFTLKDDLLVKHLNIDVEKYYGNLTKDLGYFIAKTLKKFKKLKFVEYIKTQKKKLRNKGWKI